MVRDIALSLLAIIILWSSNIYAEDIDGRIGKSTRWGSGWIDLKPSIDLRAGERLKITLGGTAKRVLVRLLSAGESPDEPNGVIGTYDVPPTSIIEVELPEDRKRIIQISVHGKQPWDYAMPPKNGPAVLQRIERVRN